MATTAPGSKTPDQERPADERPAGKALTGRAVIGAGLTAGTAVTVLAVLHGIRVPGLEVALSVLATWALLVVLAVTAAELLRRHHRALARHAARHGKRGTLFAARHGRRGALAAGRGARAAENGRRHEPGPRRRRRTHRDPSVHRRGLSSDPSRLTASLLDYVGLPPTDRNSSARTWTASPFSAAATARSYSGARRAIDPPGWGHFKPSHNPGTATGWGQIKPSWWGQNKPS